jgi:hypothetical protein
MALLEQQRDIFYLSLEEIYAWYDGRAVQTNLKGLTQLRKAEYQGYEQQDLPHHFWAYGMVYHHNSYEYPYQEVRYIPKATCKERAVTLVL